MLDQDTSKPWQRINPTGPKALPHVKVVMPIQPVIANALKPVWLDAQAYESMDEFYDEEKELWLETEIWLERQAGEIINREITSNAGHNLITDFLADHKDPTNKAEYIALLELALRLADKVHDDIDKIGRYLERAKGELREVVTPVVTPEL